TLAESLRTLRTVGGDSRQHANEVMRLTLEQNPQALGIWTAWEPDAWDGRDAEFAGKHGHDRFGRFALTGIASTAAPASNPARPIGRKTTTGFHCAMARPPFSNRISTPPRARKCS